MVFGLLFCVSHHPPPNTPNHHLHRITTPRLPQQIPPVRIYRVHADAQAIGNLLARQALRKAPEQFQLLGRKTGRGHFIRVNHTVYIQRAISRKNTPALALARIGRFLSQPVF